MPRPLVLACLIAIIALPAAHAAQIDQTRVKELRAMVDQDCGSCHGLTRHGGLGSPLTPDALADKPVEALTAAILDGRPGTPMPPWRGLLTEGEADWIAHMLKGDVSGVR